MMEAISHTSSIGGQRPPDDFFVDLHTSLFEEGESQVDFHEELSRKLWHEVAGLRKEVRITPAHVSVENPPVLTKAFLQHAFGTWIETLVGQDLREHTDESSHVKGYSIVDYQDDVLRTLNDVGRLPSEENRDDQWGASSTHERLSAAVHAFRALISNQPSWVSHIDFLLVGSEQTWPKFLETEKGRQFLEQVNTCMACTQFPMHTVRDQLAARSVLMHHEVFYPKAQAARGELAWTESAQAGKGQSLVNEYILAHDEGMRIREDHERMFAEAARRVRVLETVEGEFDAAEATLGDLQNVVDWRLKLQAVSDQLLKTDRRGAHVDADHEKHETVEDQAKSQLSTLALQGEFQSLSARMHALRHVGAIVQQLTEEGLTIDSDESLHGLRAAVQELKQSMLHQPFSPSKDVEYVH